MGPPPNVAGSKSVTTVCSAAGCPCGPPFGNHQETTQLSRADFADPNDELTRLLRTGAEPVPFNDVDWAGLSARIEQALNALDPAELEALRYEHESAVEDADDVSSSAADSSREQDVRSLAGDDASTPPRR